MPLHDYVCGSCGEREELLVDHPAPEVVYCARCGRPAARAFSVPAPARNGSGWDPVLAGRDGDASTSSAYRMRRAVAEAREAGWSPPSEGGARGTVEAMREAGWRGPVPDR